MKKRSLVPEGAPCPPPAIAVLTVALLASLLTATTPTASAAPTFHLRKVAGPIPQPTWVGAAPGTRRLFAAERRGRILVWSRGRKRVFLDIRRRVGSRGGEQGLLSVAFHPNYASNGRLFVYFTTPRGDARVYEYRGSGNRAVASSAKTILAFGLGAGAANHNGGTLVFGNDGKLYLSVGDGGGSGRVAQDRRAWRGKLLRIDIDAGSPYAIPPDNPYAGSSTLRREIWSLGLRNPWRVAVDPVHGDIWVTDVGQSRREEINLLPGGLPARANFGWARFEGSLRYSSVSLAPGTTHRAPRFQYRHGANACSISGGMVYRGTRVPALRGRFLYADFCGTWIAGVRRDGSGRFRKDVRVPGIVSVNQGPLREAYVASIMNGNIYRIVP